MTDLLQIISYPFMQRALIVGILVSICSAILGVVLVLKKYSLIGHGLSDIGFASLAFTLLLDLPALQISIIILVIASFIIMTISQKKGVDGDIAIGISSTGALSLGIILINLSNGPAVDIYSYMFGNILSINKTDFYLSIIISIFVILLYIIFYNRIFIITCDEEFAKASGINTMLYQFLISFLTAITVAIGIRLIGTLLISSLIIFPSLSAKKISNNFFSLVILSAIIAVFCFISGIYISFITNMPTGSSIVLVSISIMLFFNLISRLFK